MDNKMTFTANAAETMNMAAETMNMSDGTAKVASTVRRIIAPLARYYSHVLGTEISMRQTLLLVNAQAAFFITVFPADCHLLVRLGCLAWLVSAVMKCRDSGIKAERL